MIRVSPRFHESVISNNVSYVIEPRAKGSHAS